MMKSGKAYRFEENQGTKSTWDLQRWVSFEASMRTELEIAWSRNRISMYKFLQVVIIENLPRYLKYRIFAIHRTLLIRQELPWLI